MGKGYYMTIQHIKVAGTTFHKLPSGMFLKPDTVGTCNDTPAAFFTAILMPEPTNVYDPQAVQVLLQTTTGDAFVVGYMPKDEPMKARILKPTMANVTIIDYGRVGNYNPSYIITGIEMEGTAC